MRDIVWALFRGVTIVLAVVAMLGAAEFYYGAPDPALRQLLAGLCALSGVTVFLLQFLYFSQRTTQEDAERSVASAAENMNDYRQQIAGMERRHALLRQKIEALSAHREISRAATTHTSFEEVMDEIAKVVHDLAGAREITLFLRPPHEDTPLPRAYFGLSSERDLYLSFSETGGAFLQTCMQNDPMARGAIAAEHLQTRGLQITPKGAQTVISGSLGVQNTEVGSLRLTLYNVDPQAQADKKMLQRLVATELGHVDLNHRNVREALLHHKPVSYDAQARRVDLLRPLSIDNEPAGVLKIRFDCHASGLDDSAMSERSRILNDSAHHLARAIQGERIYEQAIKDSMTKLFNKRYMLDQLENYLRLAARHSTHLSMILIDIDHFKNVNDTYGHLTGDIILIGVAEIMRQSARASDIACRYGGEELAIILPEGSLEGTCQLAERLRERIEAHVFISDKEETLHITASLGVAEYTDGMERPEDLIARSDAALYASKENGRNRVTVWKDGECVPLAELG